MTADPPQLVLRPRRRRAPPIYPIDWPEVILDLVRVGMKLGDIGEECGFERAAGAQWLIRLRQGGQPKFHEGALLIGLWAEKKRETPNNIPRDTLSRVRNDTGKGEMPEIAQVAAVVDDGRE